MKTRKDYMDSNDSEVLTLTDLEVIAKALVNNKPYTLHLHGENL